LRDLRAAPTTASKIDVNASSPHGRHRQQLHRAPETLDDRHSPTKRGKLAGGRDLAPTTIKFAAYGAERVGARVGSFRSAEPAFGVISCTGEER